MGERAVGWADRWTGRLAGGWAAGGRAGGGQADWWAGGQPGEYHN